MEIIKKLNTHKLDFDLAWEYVQDNLDKVNALSSELLNLLDFKNGYFFTLLPNDANLKEIYNFKCGGILPQYPEEGYFINGHWSTYSRVPDIDQELSQLILKEISLQPYLSCIMDDVSGSTPKDETHPCYFDNYSIFYSDEVYSILNQKNISYDLILKCLRFSTSFWHSLGVITAADMKNVSKTIGLEKIKEICLKTEFIMVGAYDGEGYVFWKKDQVNNGIRFLK